MKSRKSPRLELPLPDPCPRFQIIDPSSGEFVEASLIHSFERDRMPAGIDEEVTVRRLALEVFKKVPSCTVVMYFWTGRLPLFIASRASHGYFDMAATRVEVRRA